MPLTLCHKSKNLSTVLGWGGRKVKEDFIFQRKKQREIEKEKIPKERNA